MARSPLLFWVGEWNTSPISLSPSVIKLKTLENINILGVSKVSHPPGSEFFIIKIEFLMNVVEAPTSQILYALILIRKFQTILFNALCVRKQEQTQEKKTHNWALIYSIQTSLRKKTLYFFFFYNLLITDYL